RMGERHRVRALGLDTDDPGSGTTRLHGRGDAADQSPTPDADDDDIDVRYVIDDLETDRPVAGDHRRIVERMDECEPFDVADALHLRERIAHVLAMQDHARAVVEARVDLGADRALRHDDGHRYAGGCTGPGIRLTGVAGGERDCPTKPGLLGERRDPVRHPARLERAGLLKMLGLEVEQPVGKLDARGAFGPDGRGPRAHEGRPVDIPVEPAGRILDGRKRYLERDVSRGALQLGHAAEYGMGRVSRYAREHRSLPTRHTGGHAALFRDLRDGRR